MSEQPSETLMTSPDEPDEQQVSASVALPYEGWSDEALIERCLLLEAERDRAREECGVHKSYREYHRDEASRYIRGLIAAKNALVATGYFTQEQTKGLDIAPRIIEYAAAFAPCFCGDIALKEARPLVAYGVKHSLDGCSYTQQVQALVAPAADEAAQAGGSREEVDRG